MLSCWEGLGPAAGSAELSLQLHMDMEHVYYEASIAIESLSHTNYEFASLIENEKLITFKDLINHDQSPCS